MSYDKKKVIILSILLLASTNITAHGSCRNIEIFDIDKGCVIKQTQSTPEIQKEVESFLAGITGIYGKFKPIPDEGYAVKLPLEPPVIVQSKWLHQTVDQVIIMFPPQEKPYLLVLDEKSRPLFFNFKGKTDRLLEKLNFQLSGCVQLV